jgi:PAT family beta-lactamase induction signal transducer AmpG
MYTALAVESGTTGLGTGAFSVLLLRLTQRRFSATQYALFSSVFALGRALSGPPAGALVDAMGWRDFFLLTILAAVPGLVMLARFVPFFARDIPPEPAGATGTKERLPLTTGGLVARGMVGFVVGTVLGYLSLVLLAALKASRQGGGLRVGEAFTKLFSPTGPLGWVDVLAPLVFGLVCAFAVAAYAAARRGSTSDADALAASSPTPS